MNNPFPFTGLSSADVLSVRIKAGNATHTQQKSTGFWLNIKKTFLEPMFLLLVLAAVLYFMLNQTAEAVFMLIAVILVASISFYQETRSQSALKELQSLISKKTKVIRDNEISIISPDELVCGDYIIAEEGTLLAADGEIIYSHDFSVNESILTGEAASVYKSEKTDDQSIFQGTSVVSGLAIYVVSKTGADTRVGKIAGSLKNIHTEVTPLERQIRRFVGWMSAVGLFVFILIWGTSFYRSGLVVASLLKALTLAMSILPEEIPVAFSTFMALGAWRLLRQKILVKNVNTVETLGAATIICLDKTGTITENAMRLESIYVFANRVLMNSTDWDNADGRELLSVAMWASESEPFDPMEKTLHNVYGKLSQPDLRHNFSMEKEYPLDGRLPMMTHVFANKSGKRIIAAKGAPERLIGQAELNTGQKKELLDQTQKMTAKGFRVLAVAEGSIADDSLPTIQDDFRFRILGLIAFYDPPKAGIANVFRQFYQSGIDIKLITGDNNATACAIAEQAGIEDAKNGIEGNELMALDDAGLKKVLRRVNVFSRTYPEAKLRIVEMLKQMGHIVAMTGDGVNDAPALKSAHIGIAMGKRGTETAREAASLILLDDDLKLMNVAIAMGRQIYINLKKAIGYIIAIHIPIILLVTLPLLLNWTFPSLFMPAHVVFFELIMGPTCSIAFENEPLEKSVMLLPPRHITASLLSIKELFRSILQGLVITAIMLLVYQAGIFYHYNENSVRALVFIGLISANLTLTLVERSLKEKAIYTFHWNNRLLYAIIFLSVALTLAIFTIPFLKALFYIEVPGPLPLFFAVLAGVIAAGWFDLFKKKKH